MEYTTMSPASTPLPQLASQLMSIRSSMLRTTKPRRLFQAYTGWDSVKKDLVYPLML